MTTAATASAAPAVISTRGLVRSFGPVRAVDGLDLDVRPGAVTALLGPSGCGKTTVLRLLAGFERPDAGTVAIDGGPVAARGVWVPPERRRVGMVFQDYALFPHLTVSGNVAYGLRRRGCGAAERHARIAEVVELVGLAGLEGRYPAELSGGQQQRVALARALAPKPRVVLLDEPFSSLDAALRAQVRTDVHRILGESATTAVFVTHDQEEALSIADEVAVMSAGRVAQLATPEQLYHRPVDRHVAAFVGDADFFAGTSCGRVAQTELGPVPLATPLAGAVEVLVRPEDLRLVPDDDGEATVLAREFYGHDQMLYLRLDTGRILRARLGPVTDLAPGDRCRVRIGGPAHAYSRAR